MSEKFRESEDGSQTASDVPLPNEPAEANVLAVSAGDFAALEERILRAVELVRQERQARTAAEAFAQAQMPIVEQLQNELKDLRAERDQVRQRVERLLKQLDSLEL